MQDIKTDKTDNQLVELILQDNQEALEILITRYQDKLIRYAKSLLNGNQSDAEDVVAEEISRAYRYLNNYNSKYSFNSWIYRIVHNQAVNLIKKNSGFFTLDIESFWQLPKLKVDSPLTKYELYKVLNKLKLSYKEVLVLFYIEEKTLNEISDILNIPPNTVAQRLTRARQKARELIQQNFKK